MDQTTLEGFAITMKDLQDRKPQPMHGLADWLMSLAARSMMNGYDKERLCQWACEVRAVQEAITQLSEEE